MTLSWSIPLPVRPTASGYAPPLPVDLLQQPNGTALAEAIQAAAFAEAVPKTTYDGLIRTIRIVRNPDKLRHLRA